MRICHLVSTGYTGTLSPRSQWKHLRISAHAHSSTKCSLPVNTPFPSAQPEADRRKITSAPHTCAVPAFRHPPLPHIIRQNASIHRCKQQSSSPAPTAHARMDPSSAPPARTDKPSRRHKPALPANELLTALNTPPHKHPSHLLTSCIHHFSTSTPPATLSALLTALASLPPSSLPAPFTYALTNAVLHALVRSHASVTVADLRHAIHLVTLLAARSHTASAHVCALRAHATFMQLASPVPVSLREPLRRLAVVCGVAHAPHTRLALFAGRRAVSILSLDGGGTRALFSLQVLKKMERVLKKPLRETFDVIAGTSTGGILAIALGLLGMPLEKVEQLYTRLAKEVFSIQTRSTKGSSTVYNAGRALLFNRGMYNTPLLQAIFHHYAGTSRLFEHAAGNSTPRVFVLSTQIRGEAVKSPRPYLHANYRVSSRYTHGCLHTLCDALRATTAAPVFFDVMLDEDGLAFCDGGVLMNNPTAVAVHEARCIWPGREIGAVVSVGTGLFEGAINVAEANPSNVPDDPSLLRKGHTAQPAAGRSMVLRVAQAVLESATDTEAVHHTLQDLLDPDVYFRLNADIGGEELLLDEHRPEVLKRLKDVGESYCTSGEGAHLIRKLANKLGGRRGAKYGLWRGKVASYARL